MTGTSPDIITRLIPFNPHRFDACMSYIAQRIYQRPLTIFELVKHHVMTDVFQVLAHGHQVIGGELEPWPFGPVIEPAYNRLKHWEQRHEESGGAFQPPEYEILDGELAAYRPRASFDPDDISPAEVDAMTRAADLLRPLSFDEAYRFFHDDGTFMGRAYNRALSERRALAWGDIIDAHDQIAGSNLQQLKRRLISYG